MSKELLNLAKADIKTAEMCVDHKDKYVKLHAAYCTQQAIEKTIKYLISQNNTDGSYPWGHDINKLILQCQQMNIVIPKMIEDKAIVYTAWEADTRYEGSLVVRKDTIRKTIEVIKQWHKNI